MTAASAWANLQDALSATAPSCAGDARFTDDGRADSANADLAPICATCPVLAECAAYARAEKTSRLAGGFWAGKRRGTRLDRLSKQ